MQWPVCQRRPRELTTSHLTKSGRMNDTRERGASSILQEEVTEDKESITKGESGVVNMRKRLNAVAGGVTLTLKESYSQGLGLTEEEEEGEESFYLQKIGPHPTTSKGQEERQESLWVQRIVPKCTTSEGKEEEDEESACLLRIAPQCTSSDFKSLFRMRRSTFEVSLVSLYRVAPFS